MSLLVAVARRLGSAALAFLAITLVTFAIASFARPVIRVDDPQAGPEARARARKLADRYALDRPAFFNPEPPDARRLSGGSAPSGSAIDAWLAGARAEAQGRGTVETRAGLEQSATVLLRAGPRLVAPMMPRLLRANPLVLGMGLELLNEAAGIPGFGRPRGGPRQILSPDEERHNDALRRSVALWWRRHENEYRERPDAWRATLGRVTETRYAAWLGDLLRLDLGDSLAIRPEAPVAALIRERLPVTALVMLAATLVLFAAGIPLGLVAAARRGGWFDRISQGALFVLHATPEAWLATLALVYLASDAHWHVFPVGGLLSGDVAEALATGEAATWSPRVLLDLAAHLVLPVLVLVLPAWVVVARHVRAAAIEALGARFVTAARARGISRRRILFVHVLRNCAPPTVTLFTSVLPGLVTGSILIETLFSLDGMGLLSFEAATQRDFPVGMAILTIVAVVMLLAHLLTDLLHALADPRVRTS